MIHKSYSEIKSGLSKKEFTSLELINAYLDRIKSVDDSIKAFLSIDPEKIREAASASDKRRAEGKELSEFDGIPIGIKDNICINGEKTTCGSKILENFISPYDATVIQKLKSKGFILFPRLNMDEFAMGSSTENSSFQITRNPFDLMRIPGGSSGGSAASVAASMLPISLGSDTGGSIRQPAALCGIFGLKPTYGRVSRYGLVAYASSLDQIGPFSNDIQGISDILSVISGKDENDSTSAKISSYESISLNDSIDVKGLKIGIMPESERSSWQEDVQKKYSEILAKLKELGASLVELDFSLHHYSIPIYYIIATAECSSNLSRFDGIRYGYRNEEAKKLEDLYTSTRTKGFGKEVKRRILLGTFSLSSGYYDAFYGQAQKARVLIRNSYIEFFKKVDLILQPTSPTTAFKIGEKTKDPIQMYKADILTTSVNLAGLPAISIPGGLDSNKLPIGLQITGNFFEEGKILSLAKALGEMSETKIELPKVIQ
ncbi:MAG: Asp-tRNA(Asn)/Glu-tRNA(Gln) amidotransferase subunit GatA [Leptospiraceae bacterium]|nr:Asp-tRNA(Asn)/Glu-tRNA(Gln) amidotransferase subunit GatA [Leptospiraceae bacterium]